MEQQCQFCHKMVPAGTMPQHYALEHQDKVQEMGHLMAQALPEGARPFVDAFMGAALAFARSSGHSVRETAATYPWRLDFTGSVDRGSIAAKSEVYGTKFWDLMALLKKAVPGEVDPSGSTYKWQVRVRESVVEITLVAPRQPDPPSGEPPRAQY